MGFIRGTAFTDDDDLRNEAVFEPNLERWLTDIDDETPTAKTSFSTQHIEANDAIMDEILKKGIDPAVVTNTGSFKKVALYYVLWHLYLGRVEEPEDVAYTKYIEYKGLWTEFWSDPYIEVTDDDDVPVTGVPVVYNRDARGRMDGYGLRPDDPIPYYER